MFFFLKYKVNWRDKYLQKMVNMQDTIGFTYSLMMVAYLPTPGGSLATADDGCVLIATEIQILDIRWNFT